ncbi:Fe2+-dependent dioxygenase [Microcoleus sp. FACHB-1515]|uniref:Fe2+-dependent dioxygenase n=1 Tax=Cyanophyceae TaxID=3028117 RepID=UPI001685235C|nr:Fe2+-dependent dioxygenase [Microcoleus sp. FACHB-1515]MBD2090162.1 Fe2+-dependent dioxygenase [Microcoleus sp. FACHB-1515]
MLLAIEDVLTPTELQTILTQLEASKFVDGKTTAGWYARTVKHNQQLDRQAESAEVLKAIVQTALKRNVLFQMVVQPKQVHSLLFSRYESGMSYGTHVDNALMGGTWRSDVSFTIFLSEPEHYEGGELVVEAMDGDRPIKLAAGAAIVYPSSYLHRVEPVTAGVRQVVVGWVQSLVRDPSLREILFDLDTVRRALFQQQGKSIEFDLLSKTHANLLRRWID